MDYSFTFSRPVTYLQFLLFFSIIQPFIHKTSLPILSLFHSHCSSSHSIFNDAIDNNNKINRIKRYHCFIYIAHTFFAGASNVTSFLFYERVWISQCLKKFRIFNNKKKMKTVMSIGKENIFFYKRRLSKCPFINETLFLYMCVCVSVRTALLCTYVSLSLYVRVSEREGGEREKVKST